MTACSRLESGQEWLKATDPNSKGCGANMRVAPVGLLSMEGTSADILGGVAQFQAALTHGHPTALAASELTAAAISALATSNDFNELIEFLLDYAHAQKGVYREEWLGDLYLRWPGLSFGSTTATRMELGWDECIGVMQKVKQAVPNRDLYRLDGQGIDPCEATGDGWTAETALATGLLCFLVHPDDPVAAIRRAAVTRGDSDSIAALAGAFAGAYHGLGGWPAGWIENIEYRDRLSKLGSVWDPPS